MEKFEINAVEMTRQIRDKMYEQTKDMSRAELLAFYREHARLMNEKAKKLIEAKRKLEHACPHLSLRVERSNLQCAIRRLLRRKLRSSQ